MRALLVLCLALLATVAEADVGIGMSAHSGDATVYVPVVTKRLLLEPYLTYAHQKLQPKNGTPASPTTSETTAIGVGIFGVKAPAPNVSIYFGARLAHLRDESTVPRIDFITGVAVAVGETRTDGDSIAPTLGFQYHLLDRLTLGGEIAVEYSDIELKSSAQPPLGPPTIETHETITRTATRTNIILRYFF